MTRKYKIMLKQGFQTQPLITSYWHIYKILTSSKRHDVKSGLKQRFDRNEIEWLSDL